MSISSVTDSTIGVGQQYGFTQQPTQLSTYTQGSGDGGTQVGRVRHRDHGGMGRALMQTLKQLLLSVPSNSNRQGSMGQNFDASQNDDESQASVVRNDMHNFMYALFQAIRSQEPSPSSSVSPYATSFDGSKFENGLSALISELASDSGSDNPQISELRTTFSALIQELRNSPSGDSQAQQAQALDLQDFLATLQQNLQSSRQIISATGNVVNAQG
ncbi:MAG TPA: hypothetical protein DEO88_13810 [Syntrophobacteraceae bacterium]|nr:hypothetical protein [Syntrophobacteraceae bacterium]